MSKHYFTASPSGEAKVTDLDFVDIGVSFVLYFLGLSKS